MTEEVELKLALSPEQARALARSSFLRALGPAKAPKRARLITTYFDTPNLALKERGIALRVRRNGAHRIQTIKAPAGSAGTLQRFFEHEVAITGETPDLSRISDRNIRRSVDWRRVAKKLQPVFRTEFERQSLPVTIDGSEIELALDRGAIAANGRREPICEAELELKSGDPKRIFELALALHQKVPFRLGHSTKAERGYALAAHTPPEARRATRVALDPAMTVGEGFAMLARVAVAHLRTNEAVVIDGRNPEGVHQMRVALRRLRALFGAFRAIFAPELFGECTSALGRMRRALGPAREWDVFAFETLDPLIAERPKDSGLTALRAAVEARRCKANQAAIAAIRDPAYTSFLLRLELILDALADTAGEEPWQAHARGSLLDWAGRTLEKRLRRLVKRGGKNAGELSTENLHEIRLEAKKIRYALDFFASLYSRKKVRAHLARLAELQDILGRLNDAELGARLLKKSAAGHARRSGFAAAMKLVAERQVVRAAAARKNLCPAWLRVRSLQPFWS